MTTLTLHTSTMPAEVYNELLSGLDELDFAFGKTAEAENARQWLLAATKAQPIGVPAFVTPPAPAAPCKEKTRPG